MIFKGYEQNLRPKLRDARGENISPKQLYFPFTFCFVVAFVSKQRRIEYLSILFVNKTACEYSAA